MSFCWAHSWEIQSAQATTKSAFPERSFKILYLSQMWLCTIDLLNTKNLCFVCWKGRSVFENNWSVYKTRTSKPEYFPSCDRCYLLRYYPWYFLRSTIDLWQNYFFQLYSFLAYNYVFNYENCKAACILCSWWSLIKTPYQTWSISIFSKTIWVTITCLWHSV